MSRTKNRASAAPPRATYSVPEVAAALGIHKSTAYRLVASGDIPSVRLGHRVVVPVAVLDALVKAAS